ncbi:hypothetical protein Pmani_019922 [Petrolisthes manimaculis]|uniref:Uncharacterized protein n=1 Tax=Petrolisthes manimaculis TaxID=1843537 RepID=A0AAE1U6V7_9EUCA|nr:hypothetical protein Pmani_019922 [Petrolisthes manimaculis]
MRDGIMAQYSLHFSLVTDRPGSEASPRSSHTPPSGALTPLSTTTTVQSSLHNSSPCPHHTKPHQSSL